jgi:uncharacterized protein YndB with AHSA1/START domain
MRRTDVVTRDVLLDGDLEEVWHSLVDAPSRTEWLDDDRPIEIVRAEVGRHLEWRWCTPDHHGVESTVTIELATTDDGRTHLTVTERVSAAANCSLVEPVVEVAAAWDRRLLGLELRCMLGARSPAHV